MHLQFSKPHQATGYTLVPTAQVMCDCGQPATHQVSVQQLNANDRRITAILPLCDDCYQLMLAEDQGILWAA